MINVVTSVLIAFGGFAQGGSGTNLILNNTITLTTDYDCGIYSQNFDEVLRYRIQARVDCDFREKKNEQGVPEYFIANIQKIDFSVFTYQPDGSLPVTATFSTNPENMYVDFDVLNLDDPNNIFFFDVDNSLTSAKFSTTVNLSMFRGSPDEVAYNSASFEIPYLVSSSTVNGTLHDVRSDISLNDISHQVRYAFNNNSGGYATGYDNGYNVGFEDGNQQGYSTGYSDGYANGVSTNQTAFTIFNGILAIGMTPINFFLTMLNFEVFGINISNFVMSLMTVMITLWFVRIITGSSGDGK